MKRLSLFILLWISILPLMAQINLVYTGTVSNILSGAPVPYHLVRIQSDSNAGTTNFFYDSTYTDLNGHFYDTVHLSPQMPVSGHASLIVEDCQNYFNFWSSWYGPNAYTIQHDFHICYNGADTLCNANFSYQEAPPLTVYFTDLSTGGNDIRDWNFGDGIISSVHNPTHVYQQPGQYYVSLSIGSQALGCMDFITKIISVNDSTNTGCPVSFVSWADSLHANLIHFNADFTGTTNNTWSWTFGDPASGSTNYSTVQDPDHMFSSPGTYAVCVTRHTIDGCTSTYCGNVTVSVNGGCQAYYTYYADSLNVPPGLSYHFIDQSQGNNINHWVWDFGDGSPISYEQNPIHTFSGTATSHVVCLTIYGADSCFDSFCETLTIGPNTGCLANFTYTYNPAPGVAVQFDDLSAVTGGTISSWQWSFGDGTGSSLQNPSHVFAQSGVYNVCLTITGNNCQDTKCREIYVGDSVNCIARFDYNHQGLTGYFHGYLNNSQTGAFYWNFGDGSTGQGANETHIYATGGMYTVTLTATDNNNCSATYTGTIFAGDSTQYYQLYGQIFAGNMPLQSGMAMIFSSDTLVNYNPYISVAPVDSMGTYYFSMVPAGSYYIYALPFLSMGFIPTYYGNVVFWENATVVSTAQLSNPYNIHLVSADSLIFGPGGITGIINTTGLKSTIVDKVTMLLMNAQGKTISYGTVSTSGAFDFTTLAYGTYFLKAEIAGVTSDLVQVVLSADQPQTNVTLSFTGNHILGINNIKPVLTAGVIYPNPVSGDAHVQITVPESMNISIMIYNITGQAVLNNHVQVSGTTTLTLPCSGLPSGIYNLTIVSDNGFRLNRKLVVTR